MIALGEKASEWLRCDRRGRRRGSKDEGKHQNEAAGKPHDGLDHDGCEMVVERLACR